jgi:cytochrome d ubiquinol oxidase subunit I
MRTADAASAVSTTSVWISLGVYFVTYMILFGFGSWYLIKVLRHGPDMAPERFPRQRNPSRHLAVMSSGEEDPP